MNPQNSPPGTTHQGQGQEEEQGVQEELSSTLDNEPQPSTSRIESEVQPPSEESSGITSSELTDFSIQRPLEENYFVLEKWE